MGRELLLIVVVVLGVLMYPSVAAHVSPSEEYVFIRVVEADPATRTYTFSCVMEPDNTYLRDWFIRPDYGNMHENVPEEATILDLPSGEHLTYTFAEDSFYHIGCLIWNSDTFDLYRGDLHIDLRKEPWDPDIVPISGDGLTATYACQYSDAGTPSWQVLNAMTGEIEDLGSGEQITHTVSGSGIYDYICQVDGKAVGLPIEYFDVGGPYFPDAQGVPHGILNVWDESESGGTDPICGNGIVESGETCDDGNTVSGDGCSATCQVESTGTCYESLADMPVTCSNGTVTNDVFDGCRAITCAAGSDSTSILACEKPSNTNPQHFEMYLQSRTGTTDVCIADTCIGDSGFARSTDYPICADGRIEPPPGHMHNMTYEIPDGFPIPTIDVLIEGSSGDGWNFLISVTDFTFYEPVGAETAPHVDNEGHIHYYLNGQKIGRIYAEHFSAGILSPGTYDVRLVLTTNDHREYMSGGVLIAAEKTLVVSTPSSSTAYTNLENIPASCNGGVITGDAFSGGRHITCASSDSSLTVVAWDKPGSHDAQYFEMYKESQTGGGIEICLGDTCIGESGFARSTEYPIYLDGGEVSICGNGIIEPGETCDDGNTVSGDGCSATCQVESFGTCFENVEHVPASCAGGIITSDTFSGGRHITCASSDSSLTVVAWDKPGSHDAQYFEMYKESQTGGGIEICLGDTCIGESGFAQSPHYPICTDGGGPGVLGAPVWLSHTGTTGVSPTYFHLEVRESENTALHQSSDWEIWDASMLQRVWSNLGATGALRIHTHAPDGVFENALAGASQLDFATMYHARVRFTDTNDQVTAWSAWQSFTTAEEPVLDPSAPEWTAASGFRVEEVATGLSYPVHVAAAPPLYESLPGPEPYLYVTELYGTIKVIYTDGSVSTYADNLLNFDPFGSITGGGQMGVIGLYVEPTAGDLYVGMVYLDDNQSIKNKVEKFVSSSDGSTFTSRQVLLDDLPSSASHQVQQITKGPDGKIYVNLGDALTPSTAQSDSLLAGKIIRMNTDGSDVETYAKGFRNPFGGDWRPGADQLFITDNAPGSGNRLVRVVEGVNYGWGLNDDMLTWYSHSLASLDTSPVDVAFNPGGAGFPAELTGKLYVAVAGPIFQQGVTGDGKEIVEFTLDDAGYVTGSRVFLAYSGTGYGTPIGLDFAADGLYFTDIYGEAGNEGRVLRVVVGTPGSGGEGIFRTNIFISPWYPKLRGDVVEYEFTCNAVDGSGSYVYDWDFGDGDKQFRDAWNKKFHEYPYTDQTYTVSCTAHDLDTGLSVSDSTTINPIDYIEEQQ